MAAEVFGSIVGANGVEDITLNNAATESTLRQLLASSMGANKQTLDTLKDLAKSAGVDTSIAEQNLDKLGAGAGNLDGDFGTLQQSSKKVDINFKSMMVSTGQLIEGTATLGGILNTLGGVLPGKLGFLIEMLGKAADFQDKSLQAYQKISDAGVHLAGDLIQIRISAAQMGLTLDQFTSLIKNNGPALASLGDTVDGGTKQFIKFSTALIHSDAGRQLMNMGYSLEQINANSLDYLLISGGRRKGELEGAAATKQTTDAVVNYMSELDKLANLTGKSREKVAQEIKDLALEPAWQAFLNDPKNKSSKAAMETAQIESYRFGTSAAKNFQAAAMGLTVWSKDTAAAAGILPRTYSYLAQMSDVAKSNMSEGDKRLKIQELSSRAMYATVESARAMGRESLAKLSQESGARGETAKLMLNAMADADRRGINSLQAQITRDNEAAKLSLVTNKQVENASAVNLALKDIQVSLITLLKGPLEIINPILKWVAEHLAIVSTGLLVLGGILAAYKAYALGKEVLGAAGKGNRIDALFGEWGHSQAKGLWVKVVPGFSGQIGRSGGGSGAAGAAAAGAGAAAAGAGAAGAGAATGRLAKLGAAAIPGMGAAADAMLAKDAADQGKTTAAWLYGLAGATNLAGAAADLTGVGAVAGVPLGIISAGLTGLGMVAEMVSSGDKKQENSVTQSEQESSASSPLVTSYQKRTAENSDRMILILRELTDIARAQKESAEWVPTVDSKGVLNWNKRRGPSN
jgi:hypothetical protein